MKNKKDRILIIEENIKSFERFVKKEELSYNYKITGSIDEAKLRLKKGKFDVVLMDYALSNGAGFDWFKKIRKVPFIIIIGSGDEKKAVKAVKAGAYDYLMKDANGNYPKTLPITVENVIRRRCAEQELRKSQEKYRNLFKNVEVGMFRSKADGSALLAANNKLAEIFGFSVEEMITAPLKIRWADPKDWKKMVQQLEKAGSLTGYVVPIVAKNGEIKTVLASMKFYSKQSYIEGSVVDITKQINAEKALKKAHDELEIRVEERTIELIKTNALLFDEITERKRIEEALKKTRDELKERAEKRTAELKALNFRFQREILEHEQAEFEIRKLNRGLEQRVNERTAELEAVNKELKDFAYIVSHDLKAPLRAVNQLAQWISQDYADVFDEDGKEQMALLISRVNRMDSLIQGILQYSRIGRIIGKEEQVDMNILVEEVKNLISLPDSFQIAVKGRLPIVQGDITRMEQVFLNLLSNAVKYMDKSKGKVNIKCSDEKRYWKFSVSDNGPGIEEKHFETIFQIFQTLTSRDERESTGIGLTLVKKIVELYGGKIWVESKIGKGTTFYFTLPKKGEKDEEQ